MVGGPLVSIVTPILNGTKYVQQCIQSVLGQQYPHVEHIFVDGGSTDGTLDLLARYKVEYPGRIKYISESDAGVGEALNKGFRIAKGEILGWLDSDDLYESDAIITAVEFFKSNRDAQYVFGGCRIINEVGELIGEVPIADFNFKRVVEGRQYISLSAAFYRRVVFESVGDFNTVGNAFDYWIRVAKRFPLHRVEKPFCSWRLHRDSIGFSREARKVEMIRKKLREDFLLSRQYGSSIFSPRSRKYFVFLALSWLRLFRFFNLTVRMELRRYRLVDKMLRALGG